MSTRLLLVAALACVVVTTPVIAGTISMAWNPVTHNDLAGYRIYYATTPGGLSEYVEVGLVTDATLSGLDDCTAYYVAVKAVDGEGNESDLFSNLISGWSRPDVVSVAPLQVQRNSQASLTLNGANYQDGASVTFLDPAITVDGVALNGCQQLVVDVTVGPSATLGPVDVKVVNPDQVFGVGTGLFGVVADDSAPVISSVAAGPVEATRATISWSTDEPATSQVVYRRQGQSTYREGASDVTLITGHELTIFGLEPETTYEFLVRSTDAEGNDAESSPQLLTTLASEYSYIRFEAETGVLSTPIGEQTGAASFERAWIELPSGSQAGTESAPSGTAEFGFHLPYAATWTVWIRVQGSGTTWFEEVDGFGLAGIDSAAPADWSWSAGRSYVLDEGLHTLGLGGGEPGAMADRLLITDDPDFLPSEQPEDDDVSPDGVEGVSAVNGDGANLLNWTNPFDDDDQLILVLRYRTDGAYPLSPADGYPLVSMVVTPGSLGSFEHTDLVNGASYNYSLFVVDESGNASDPVHISSTPAPDPPGSVENLHRTDTE